MKRLAAFIFAALALCYLTAPVEAQFKRECRYGFCIPGGGPTGTPVSNACINSFGTTITFTAQGVGGADPRRVTVVSINWDDSTAAGTAELNSVTVGGVTMQRAVRAAGDNQNSNSEVWWVANPTGTSANIVATFSTAVDGVTIEVYRLIGYSLSGPTAASTGTTTISQAYNNKQLAIAAASRRVNVSTSLSNMTNDFSSACGANLWGVHASQALHGNNGTLTTTINPTSSTPLIAMVVWATTFPTPPVSGLIGWWDASQFSSLAITTGNIITATDLSGHGNDVTSPAGPPYLSTGFNGLPAFGWNGASALLKTSFAFGIGNTLTAFFAIQMDPATASFGRAMSYFAGGSNDADNNASFLIGRNAGSNAWVLYRNASTASSANLAAGPHTLIVTVDSSGVMTNYVDGVSAVGNTLNAAFGASGTLALGIAAFTSTSQWNGPMGEAGISTAFTNSTDVATLQAYLKNKWNTP